MHAEHSVSLTVCMLICIQFECVADMQKSQAKAASKLTGGHLGDKENVGLLLL